MNAWSHRAAPATQPVWRARPFVGSNSVLRAPTPLRHASTPTQFNSRKLIPRTGPLSARRCVSARCARGTRGGIPGASAFPRKEIKSWLNPNEHLPGKLSSG